MLGVCVKLYVTIWRADGQFTQEAAYVVIPHYSNRNYFEKLNPTQECYKVSFPLYSVDPPKKPWSLFNITLITNVLMPHLHCKGSEFTERKRIFQYLNPYFPCSSTIGDIRLCIIVRSPNQDCTRGGINGLASCNIHLSVIGIPSCWMGNHLSHLLAYICRLLKPCSTKLSMQVDICSHLI